MINEKLFTKEFFYLNLDYFFLFSLVDYTNQLSLL